MFSSNIVRGSGASIAFLICLLAVPCTRGAGNGSGSLVMPLSAPVSPEALEVAPQDAWRFAELFAGTRPGCEVVVGRGDSMLPVYRDGTVLVLERMDMAALQQGMTVVFIGDSGRPVAHTLVEKTVRGWCAAGLNNGHRDQTFIRSRNYIGTVIRAFSPNPSLASQRFPASDPAAVLPALGD